MNRSTFRQLLACIALGTGLIAVVALAADEPAAKSRPDRWKKVDAAIAKGLPQTAIKELEPIIESALKDKAYPEAIKAICKKIAYEGNIQGNKPEEKITRMQAEIAKAPKEMVPVMDAVLANWYWHYFQQNRWRFQQRSATAAAPGNDFTTWDLPRLFAEIDKQFAKALAAEKELKAIPIASYDALVEKGTVPDTYRPTMFDFVAFEALNFYAAGEQAGAKAEDTFEYAATSPALASVEEFLKWVPATTDVDSPMLKAIKLYQNLLAFHTNDANKDAFLDADLFRLQFGHAHAFGDEKTARYKAALKAFADQWADHELSATARHRWATILHGEGESVEARAIALQGKNAFPNSHGGMLCHNLILQIEAKEVQTMTERVWNDPLPVLRVQYRNIAKVYFRAVKADWIGRLTTKNRWRPDQLDGTDYENLAKLKPELEWNADLAPTDDYQQRTQDVPAPKGLKPGFYFILSSWKADFADAGNSLSATDIWVSDLALVIRQTNNTGKLDGFVLTAKGGDPVPNAKVRTFNRNNQNNVISEGANTTTDANGFFSVAGPNQRGLFLLASHDGHELASQNEHYLYAYPNQYRAQAQTVLFTDRSLYRPGQTVHFKGITLLANTQADDYKVLPNRKLTVVFQDPNGKEIAKMAVTSNDFGSFSGNFTAPRDRLMGQMHIVIPGEPGGAVHFNVEEYKRPKFQVAIEAPKEAPKLNGEVKVVGKATAYTGAAINGAKVRWRVAREVRWPVWFYDCFWWRLPPNRGAAQEIAHGTATTETDGTFTVTFTAKPDLTVPEKDEPTFHYTVYADVIDSTGETRSASKGTAVGYTALQANLTADEWLTVEKDVILKLSTTTLDGEGQAAKGTVKVHALKAPDEVKRPDMLGMRVQPRRGRGMPLPKPVPDSNDIRTWALGDLVKSSDFATEKDGKKELPFKLGVGVYRAIVETQDRFGKPVTAQLNVRVLKPDDVKFAIKIPQLLAAPKWSLEPGSEFSALWGTGYDRGRAFVEIEHRGKAIQSFWTDPEKTQIAIKQKVDEGMRGGFTVRTTFVRENRGYMESRHVDVPWSNKDLTVKWERFVSKLEPAKKETYTAVIAGPKAAKAVAEMVAALYDASLDAYKPHGWLQKFNVFRGDHSSLSSYFDNSAKYLYQFRGTWSQPYQHVDHRYRILPHDITTNLWNYQYMGRGGMGGFGGGGFGGMPGAPAPMAAAKADGADRKSESGAVAMDAMNALGEREQLRRNRGLELQEKSGGGPGDDGPDLSKVAARTNLNETAFFFPHLTADADGTVKLEFTMPEALTKWKFMGFAHDKDLKSGYLQDEVVTAKELMVQPNPPRFLREGDVLEFTVKVSNQSATKQVGKVRLTLANAITGGPVDAPFGNTMGDQSFDIPAGESRGFSWKLTVPDGAYPITYKAVGATDRLSDGEEGMLPVLSKRILVTESIPLPIRGNQTKTFEFKKLQEAAKSNTLKHQSLTVQMTSQPAWYAVLALPYLMEYPHECSEQTFNRLYANAIAKHIAAGDPKIRRVFDAWKNIQPEALKSPLEKNQDLKSAVLEETPWLRDANKESEARRNVGILFDENRLNEETARGLKKLTEMQRDNGMWPWFPGGPDNEYLSLYIVTGFGRMRHLGVKIDTAPAVKAVTRLDAWMDEKYKYILKHSNDPESNHLNTSVALYLYGRSFFLKDKAVAKEHQTAIDYWQRQARNHWLKLANRQSQAHLSLGLKRFGDQATPKNIMASIKERSVSNEEMGMFWRDTELSWWWYHAPIETQAVMIEAFDEVMNDGKSVEDCKVWLLKQKQTQNWKTTKATADAVYALLLRGDNLLKSDALVEVTLGGEAIKPENVEAGTGFYEQKFLRGEVKPDFGKITVKKTDAGVSWGSVHWQYLEDVSKITVHDGTPLKLEKKLFKRTFTKKGPVLEAVAGAVAVGDEIVCRVILRTDRDMEYVHLKDHRGSGTEPVNVLSQYKFQDGLYYYESTKDTASHFFIDYLPKGVYVFEYAVRVQHKGQYPTGLANIQCMYAPEFNSHSESVMLDVK